MTQLQTERGRVRVPAGIWKIDPAHSSVEFEIKHMMIATVRGRFTDFEGTIEAHEDLSRSRVHGSVKVASIDTGQPDRDAHLRSPEFFDAERYPEIRYGSSRIEHVEGARYRVVGNMTIRDVTREVVLDCTVEGAGTDPWGNERVGLSAQGVINRYDFGLTWQQRLASGGLLVGESVKLLLDVSAVRADES